MAEAKPGGFDLYNELTAGLRDAAGALRFPRWFAGVAVRPLTSGDGLRSDELPVPAVPPGPVLAARSARRQDRLVAPAQPRVDSTGQALVFRVEHQHVTQWGIPPGRRGRPDPPVVFQADGWRPFLPRLPVACVEMVLPEWLPRGWAHREPRPRRLGPHGDRPGVHAGCRCRCTLWAVPDDPPTRWYGGFGAVPRVDAEQWVWVRAVPPEGLTAVRRAVPGDRLLTGEA